MPVGALAGRSCVRLTFSDGFWVQFGIQLGLSAISYLSNKRRRRGSRRIAAQRRPNQIRIRGDVDFPLYWILGECRIRARIFYHETRGYLITTAPHFSAARPGRGRYLDVGSTITQGRSKGPKLIAVDRDNFKDVADAPGQGTDLAWIEEPDTTDGGLVRSGTTRRLGKWRMIFNTLADGSQGSTLREAAAAAIAQHAQSLPFGTNHKGYGISWVHMEFDQPPFGEQKGVTVIAGDPFPIVWDEDSDGPDVEMIYEGIFLKLPTRGQAYEQWPTVYTRNWSAGELWRLLEFEGRPLRNINQASFIEAAEISATKLEIDAGEELCNIRWCYLGTRSSTRPTQLTGNAWPPPAPGRTQREGAVAASGIADPYLWYALQFNIDGTWTNWGAWILFHSPRGGNGGRGGQSANALAVRAVKSTGLLPGAGTDSLASSVSFAVDGPSVVVSEFGAPDPGTIDLNPVPGERETEDFATRNGTFFTASQEMPTHRINFQAPDALQSLSLRFEFRTGAAVSNAGEKLFWLGWPRHRDLVGYGIVRNGQLLIVHGFGLPNDEKRRDQVRYNLRPNTTYEVQFDFHGGDHYQLQVTPLDESMAPANVTGIPSISYLPAGQASITFGGEGTSAEPIQPGASFSDLVISGQRAGPRLSGPSPLPPGVIPGDPADVYCRQLGLDREVELYEVNGIVSSDDRLADVADEMGFAGSGGVVSDGGVQYAMPGWDREPVAHLDATHPDVQRLPWRSAPPLDERVNAASVTLANSRAHHHKPYTTAQVVDQAQRVRDGQLLHHHYGSKGFMTSPVAATIILRQQLAAARPWKVVPYEMPIEFDASLRKAIPGQRITLNDPGIDLHPVVSRDPAGALFGYGNPSGRYMRLLNRTFNFEQLTMRLLVVEHPDGVFAPDQAFPGLEPDPSAPGSFVAKPTGLSLFERAYTTDDGVLRTDILGTSEIAAVAKRIVQWRPVIPGGTPENPYTSLTVKNNQGNDVTLTETPAWGGERQFSIDGSDFTLPDVRIGVTLEFRLIDVSFSGANSEPSDVATITPDGMTDQLADPSGLSATPMTGDYLIEWELPNEPDYGLTRIRHKRGVSTGATPPADAVAAGAVRGTSAIYQLGGSAAPGSGRAWIQHEDRRGRATNWAAINVAQLGEDENEVYVDIVFAISDSSTSAPALGPNDAITGARRIPMDTTTACPYLWAWARTAKRSAGGLYLEWSAWGEAVLWGVHEDTEPPVGAFQIQFERRSRSDTEYREPVDGNVSSAYPYFDMRQRRRVGSAGSWTDWGPWILMAVLVDGVTFEGVFARFSALQVGVAASTSDPVVTPSSTWSGWTDRGAVTAQNRPSWLMDMSNWNDFNASTPRTAAFLITSGATNKPTRVDADTRGLIFRFDGTQDLLLADLWGTAAVGLLYLIWAQTTSGNPAWRNNLDHDIYDIQATLDEVGVGPGGSILSPDFMPGNLDDVAAGSIRIFSSLSADNAPPNSLIGIIQRVGNTQDVLWDDFQAGVGSYRWASRTIS
ncbi:hypothetical protein [Candidatus Poriferisodalis sp.]|uniref:hypothetical protein n=1 Tax=Candidatus Poriferisodalis sp. TaxID=3101277 RepID=UPI003B015FD9